MNKKEILLKQKKRLIALGLALTMGVTSLTGCGGFKYEKQEDGIVVVTGEISFDELKAAKLVHITNEIAELDEYYLVIYESTFVNGYSIRYIYVDVETGKTVYDEQNDDYKNFKMEVVLDRLVDYLYKYDMVKDEYTIDDVVAIKEYLLDDETLFTTMQSNNTNKPLAKKRELL